MPQNVPPTADQELFFQLWKQCRKETCHPECGCNCSACRPAPWVVTQLFKLMSTESSKTIEDLTPAIRKMIEESRFIKPSGDLLNNPPNMPPIDKQTNLVVETLKRMRNAKVFWATVPAER